MSILLHHLENFLTYIIGISVLVLELFGVIVLTSTALKCFVQWLRHSASLRLDLARGIAISLEFKLGSEVLRTVIVRDWSELGILGAVIILRGLLTFLIHWEISQEERGLHP